MLPTATSAPSLPKRAPSEPPNPHDPHTPQAPQDTRRRLKAVVVGSLGNLVEWYDFYVYSAFSLYFASAFFPGKDPLVAQLQAALLFAFGFLVRPVGGWWFGVLADRRGRAWALTLSVLLMSLGSLMIALTPTYAQIGVAAPVLLAVARLLQGLSLGGEYGTSATYVAEQAPPGQRGFYAGFMYTTLIGGQLCAITLLMLLQQVFLSPEQLLAWGWRIPFAVGAVLALGALVMRRQLHESAHFEQARQQAPPDESIVQALVRNPRPFLQVIGLTMGGTAAFYTYTTYMQKFLKLSVGLTEAQGTLVTFGSLLLALALQPLYGAISDRVGRKPVLVWFGVTGTLGTAPLLMALANTRSPWVAWALLCLGWLIISGYTSICALVKAELFPTRVRATGVGVAHAVTVSIFGGTTESLALGCKQAGHEAWFYAYLTVVVAISLGVYLSLPETRFTSELEQSAEASA